MKVEFLEVDPWGLVLWIDGGEFVKAKSDLVEFYSVEQATRAFARLFGSEYAIDRNHYDAVLTWLENGGDVLFAGIPAEYGIGGWVEAYALNNNRPKRVIYCENGQYTCVRRGVFNPNAVENIKKRHQEEMKK